MRRLIGTSWPPVQLAAVAVAWLLWSQDPSRWWVLLIAAPPLVVGLLIRNRSRCPTFLDAAMGVFLTTACIGVWAAYDRDGTLSGFADPRPAGWQALWGLCLAALAFFALRSLSTAAQDRWALALLAGFGAALAGWFVATHDWSAQPVKWELAVRVGEGIQDWLPPLPGPRLNPNIVGGIVAALTPLGLALVADVWDMQGRRRLAWAAWGALTSAVMSLGLGLTTTRGAWLGLGVALGTGAACWLLGRLGWGWGRRALAGGLVALLGVLVLVVVTLSPAFRGTLMGLETVARRVALVSEALLLVRDYPFTGVGLGMFGAVHSTYVLLIHVPVQSHAHTLLLDVAAEQGVAGALAAVGLLGGAAWLGLRALAQGEGRQPALTAGLLSLLTMAVHGLVDDPFYSSRGVWLLWAPVGLVVAASSTAGTEARVCLRVRDWDRRILVGITAALAVLLLVLLRPALEVLYANLGAVHQTRVELRAYDVRTLERTLDDVRRTVDLTRAEHYYHRALSSFPAQATARTRLAAIAMSRGAYEEGLVHARTAWNAGHRDRVTRLLLGDALVADGQPQEAAQVIHGLSWAEERLVGQAYARYGANGDHQRAAYAWQAVAALNPANTGALDRARQAEERMRRP